MLDRRNFSGPRRQRSGHVDRGDHGPGIAVGQRGQTEGHPADAFDIGAAASEHDDGAEDGIVGRANDDLDARRHHRLDDDTLDPGIVDGARRRHDVVEHFRRRVRGHIEADASRFRFVNDARRRDFHGEGGAALLGIGDSRGGIDDQARIRRRDPVS